MKIKYEVLSNLDHDNKLYGRGDSVELEDEHAAPLLAAGVIVAAPPAPEGEDAAGVIVAAPPAPEGEDAVKGKAKKPEGEDAAAKGKAKK